VLPSPEQVTEENKKDPVLPKGGAATGGGSNAQNRWRVIRSLPDGLAKVSLS